MQQQVVVIDIETAPLRNRVKGETKKKWRDLALLPKHSFITRIGAYFPDSGKYAVARTVTQQKKLLNLLNHKQYGCIAMNGKFDLVHIYHKYGINLHLEHDPAAMAHALDNADRVGLKELAAKWLGVSNWAVDDFGPSLQTLLKEGYDYKPLEQYLKKDVIYTWKLYQLFTKLLRDEPDSYKLYHEHYMPVIRAYLEIEKNGLYFNKKQVNMLVEKWQPNLDALYKQIMYRIHDVHMYPLKYKHYVRREPKLLPFKLNSPKQLGDLFYEYMGLPILTTTKSGNPSTDAKTFQRLLMLQDLDDDNARTLQLIRKYKDYNKLVKDFLKPLQKDNEPIPSFRPYGTETGRTSCSNPNIQQLPRNKAVRSCLTARSSNRILVEIDYSQVELRVAAFLSQDAEMCQAYRRGEDLHTRTAQVISKGAEVTYESRNKAKAINFGMLYGMGAKSLADSSTLDYGQYMSESQAEEYRDNFYSTYEGYAEWLEDTVREAKIDGYASSLIGRKRTLHKINSRQCWQVSEDERKAVNTPIQSLASDILVSCLPPLVNLPNISVIGTVHDAILFEIDKEHLVESLRTIVDIMENPPLFKTFNINFNIPLVAEVDVGPWGKGTTYVKGQDF